MAEHSNRSNHYVSSSSVMSYPRSLPRALISRDPPSDRTHRIQYRQRETDLTPSARLTERKERNEPYFVSQSVPRSIKKEYKSDTIPRPRPIHKLSCPVCLHDYTNEITPKILTCGHTFCLVCLEKLQKTSQIRCPLCKKAELRLVSELPVNFIAKEVNEVNNAIDECKIHRREIGAFCSTDKSLLCWECLSPHTKHSIYSVSDPKIQLIANEKRKHIESIGKKLATNIQKLQEFGCKLNENLKEINCLVDSHIEGYKKAKNEIIQKIEEIFEKRVEEIKEKAKIPDDKKIAEKINIQISKLNGHVEELNKEKDEFEKMSALRKLEWKETVPFKEELMPQIEMDDQLREFLKKPIKYKEEIFTKLNQL
ncbi:unnamed protein product [Blepharisma stoltei]|uniref:RING-type domain-containing protein n=1 Tax=Blepharisma stoltei TaxID=1481888 RepID=A0AAU9J250_9CILI|nr:unnamed protein product [Blepharisma stoltei]